MSEEQQKQRLPLTEWYTEGLRRFGPNEQDWRFTCPVCGNVATARDFARFKDQGAHDYSAYQECLGRYVDGIETPDSEQCRYAAYGLFKLAPTQVEADDGTLVEAFAFADTE